MAPQLQESKSSGRVTLKLKTSTGILGGGSITATPTAVSPPPAVPAATPTGTKKIVLKRSLTLTPAGGVPIPPATAAASQSARTPNGAASKSSAKKRTKADAESGDDVLLASVQRAPKRPKLVVVKSGGNKAARNPSIVLKHTHKAELPMHPKGEGYDSEDEDRESDPSIEEQIIFRMLPGEHCDYLRQKIEDRKIGLPAREGGADFQLKWLTGVDRRAMVTVMGTHFAAVLVDLPTITEGMKTWDKRNFMKSADICQMLLVFGQVSREEEARVLPLPVMVTKDFRWPHGLTPPMHDCVHRRFRKRLSKKEIQDKEAELERLLSEDKKAQRVRFEIIDENYREGDQEEEYDEEEEDDEDAIGEPDDSAYFGGQTGVTPAAEGDAAEFDDVEVDEELEAEIAELFKVANGAPADDPVPQADETPATARTPTPPAESPASAEASDEDEDDEEEMDNEQQAAADHARAVREDIRDLEKQVENLTQQRNAAHNAILRKRLSANIDKFNSELRLKKASIGIVDE